MTLVSRVSAFFLAALAVCLAGFSLSTYWLIREHLYSEFDQQLQNALNVLVAAAEVESDGVKWQPSDHTIQLGDENDAEEVRWVIVNELGHLVDRSRNLNASLPADRDLLVLARSPATPGDEPVNEPAQETEGQMADTADWRLLHHHLAAPAPRAAAERDFDEFAGLQITVARDSREIREELLRLALLVSVLPLAMLAVAALAGRAYCRRALLPLWAMVTRARSMTGADFRLRLPVSTRGDELTEMAAAFNALLDQLAQAFERQHRFAGDAAHQLRTPLTVLRGQVEVALRRTRSAEEYHAVLSTLLNQTSELQQIVESLLFLARPDGDGPLPNVVTVQLSQWLPEFLAHWQQTPRGADLITEIDPGASVQAVEPLLAQALNNLIGNAFQYSPAGSPVTLSARVDGAWVVLSVQDRGCGIAPQDQKAVFEPFFRSARARQLGIPGTGLGLPIVARIAQALGGQLTCDSQEGVGSRFSLQLPNASSNEHANRERRVHRS